MNIAVFGTGAVGQIISEKLVELGHTVVIGTRNVADTLARTKPDGFGRPAFGEWHKTHPAVRFDTYDKAAASATIIINATNGSGTLPALAQAHPKNLAGKILLDISNPLDHSQGFPPTLFVSNTDSLAEQIQRTYPDLKVVKSLNTMTAFVMVNPALLAGHHHVFMSGNDPAAKASVKELLSSFGWPLQDIIDLGDITTARGTEQLLPIWIRLWGALKTPIFNFSIALGKAG